MFDFYLLMFTVVVFGVWIGLREDRHGQRRT
jgi:hypothetical protein